MPQIPECAFKNPARALALATLFLLAIVAGPAFAQGTTAPAPAAVPALTDSVGADTAAIAVADTGAAATGLSGVDRIAEIRAGFTPENKRYARIRATLGFVSPFIDILIALVLLTTGASAWMRDVAHARFQRRYPRVLVYLALYLPISIALSFPLSAYTGYFLEHQFGLSNQTFFQWLSEQGKDLLLSFVLLGLTGLLALAYAAIGKSPRRWWLWLAAGTVPVIMISVLIQPLLIDPLYNKFVPLQNQELKGKILALAEKAGIPGRNVYQVDKSKQTKKYNAYVSGFGASQRIVLWDTTLQGMKEDEILFVMGHEMGHYVLKHIWKAMVFNAVLSVLLFWFSWWSMNWAVKRWGARWGFTQLDDIASLPLLGIALTVISLIVQPLANSAGRMVEHEADVFGLEVTHSNDAGARAFIKLGSQNKSDPEPSAIVKAFQYTHPPLIERVRFALEYKPWETGEPNKAFKPKP